jgi:hypothetical protein
VDRVAHQPSVIQVAIVNTQNVSLTNLTAALMGAPPRILACVIVLPSTGSFAHGRTVATQDFLVYKVSVPSYQT